MFFIYLGVKTTFSCGESVVLVGCFMFLFIFVFISFCFICPIASFVQKQNIVNIVSFNFLLKVGRMLITVVKDDTYALIFILYMQLNIQEAKQL
jgi:hypothetical protein